MKNPLDIGLPDKIFDFFEKITSSDDDIVEVSVEDMSPEVRTLLDDHIQTKILLSETTLSPEVIAAREKALSPTFEKLAEMGWEKQDGKYYRKRIYEELDGSGSKKKDTSGSLGSTSMPGYKGPTGSVGSQRPSRMDLPLASDLPQTPSYPGIPPHPDSKEYANKAMAFAGSPAIAGLLTNTLIERSLLS